MTESPDAERWFYLCPDTALATPNAFVATRIGGVPVVAQNLKGRVAAFRNVCTHRFAVIHAAASGCAPLRCPYHGWSFDADGVPVGLPFNPTDFQLDQEARRRLALHPVSLAWCGRLAFVRLAPDGLMLEEQLGNDLFARLAALSTTFHHPATAGPEEDGPEEDGPEECGPEECGERDGGTWERFNAGNLRIALRPGRLLRLEGFPPPGTDPRFARADCFRPTENEGEPAP
jgi:nitrite reductase/ring-hydroxylating ferredoxin subunit